MSGLGNHGHVVRDQGRWISGSHPPPLSPRCGKPMTRYEASNGPMIGQPVCGRPEGHRGPCRSSVALSRQFRAWPRRAPRICGCGCGDMTAGWGAAFKRGHNRDSAGRWAAA